jgi:hypothetical protein
VASFSPIRSEVKSRPDLTFLPRFCLCAAAALVIWFFVDMEKGRAQAIAFSIQQRGLSAEVRQEQVANVIGEQALVKA